MQEAAIAAVSGEDTSEPQEEEGMPTGSTALSSTGNPNGGEDSEVARFGAAKEKKHSLENGITVFNRSGCAVILQSVLAAWFAMAVHISAAWQRLRCSGKQMVQMLRNACFPSKAGHVCAAHICNCLLHNMQSP